MKTPKTAPAAPENSDANTLTLSARIQALLDSIKSKERTQAILKALLADRHQSPLSEPSEGHHS